MDFVLALWRSPQILTKPSCTEPQPQHLILSCAHAAPGARHAGPHLLPLDPACELNDQLGIVSFYLVGDPESMCGETYMISPEVQQDLYG